MKDFFSRFVLFCSGINTKFLLEHCPEDRHKFYPIGLGVIVTASLAFISMIFASHSIFGTEDSYNWIYLVIFSIFWAFAIFMIDWGLVKTMSKPDFSNFSAWDKTKYAFPVLFRLLVALIISFSVSRPLEVKIYEKRLRGQIEKDRLEYIKREQRLKRNDNKKTFDDPLNEKNKKIQENIGMMNKGPQSETYKINMQEYNKCKSEYEIIHARNFSEITRLNNSINNIRKSPNSYTNHKMEKSASNAIRSYRNEISKLRSEIENKANDCSELASKISEEDTNFKNSFKGIQQNLDSERNSLSSRSKQQQKRDSLDLISITKASYVSFDSIRPGLITQLESMSNFEKTDEGKSAGWVRTILLLLIMCIDTAPIVIKLLTRRGNYEVMTENETEKLNFLSHQENTANKHLIKDLSLARREVLNEAIKKWKIKEMDNENTDEIYINRG